MFQITVRLTLNYDVWTPPPHLSSVVSTKTKEVPTMKKSNVIGFDLAKNVMSVCKVSTHGELLSNKALSSSKLKKLLAKATPSIVAMEGCGACH
jgi:hypothetical protein